MTASSDKNINSYPATFPSFCAFKRFQRAKLWRSQKEKESTKQTTSIHNSAMVWPSPQFFKYIKDVKTGNVKIDPAPDVSNRAEGGVIHPNSISLMSEELGVTCLVPSSIDNVITPDSIKSRVIQSQILKKGGVTETCPKVCLTTDTGVDSKLSCALQPVSTVGIETNFPYLIPNRFSVLAFSDSESDDDGGDNALKISMGQKEKFENKSFYSHKLSFGTGRPGINFHLPLFGYTRYHTVAGLYIGRHRESPAAIQTFLL